MSPAGGRAAAELRRLAASCGIQARYRDASGGTRSASVDSLAAAVEAFGIDLAAGAAAALAAREDARSRRLVPPVAVAWDGEGSVQAGDSWTDGRRVEVEVALEGGEAAGAATRIAGGRIALPPVPPGYHTLSVRAGKERAEGLLISAPRKALAADSAAWGVFLPLYALRTPGDWGTGDLSGLAALASWARDLGASMAGTLPMLAAFLDDPFDPSPYSPASRLFWNELYADPSAAPEFAASARAREIAASPGFRRRLAGLRRRSLADYREVMAAKREVLEEMAAVLPEARRRDFEMWVRENPRASDYARFRAETERRRRPWQEWPAPARAGRLEPGGGVRDLVRYHLYVQWITGEQLEGVGSAAPGGAGGLYLDLPLGVNPSGYDPWRERGSFALGASAGAPPDTFFTGGQDWGFPPMHPEGIREDRLRYPAACIRNLAQRAAALRIDHVMWLHRLFWIPSGMSAAEGVYVRYPAEELHAVLTLESARTGAVIVGEDLGTVPGFVRRAMGRHRIHRSHVIQYELAGEWQGFPRAPRESLAGLNTHDMVPFAGFLAGADIDQQVELGLISRTEAGPARRRRAGLAAALLRDLGLGPRTPPEKAAARSLERMAEGPARIVMVNLEDLWGERESQNLPGTSDATHPNWRRRAARSLPQMQADPSVSSALRALDAARRVRGRR